MGFVSEKRNQPESRSHLGHTGVVYRSVLVKQSLLKVKDEADDIKCWDTTILATGKTVLGDVPDLNEELSYELGNILN